MNESMARGLYSKMLPQPTLIFDVVELKHCMKMNDHFALSLYLFVLLEELDDRI